MLMQKWLCKIPRSSILAAMLSVCCLAHSPNVTGWTINEVSALSTGIAAVNPTEHPWLALLVIREFGGVDEYVCGGALVHPLWVVTAGHCLFPGPTGKPTKRVLVRLHKSAERVGSGAWAPGPAFVAAAGVPHPGYVPLELLGSVAGSVAHRDDVALVELPYAVVGVDPLRFSWDASNWNSLSDAVVGLTQRGYGVSAAGNDAATVLREIKLSRSPARTDGRCTGMDGTWGANTVLGDLCAGGKRLDVLGNVVESCGGDSGTPLFVTPGADASSFAAAGAAHLDGLTTPLGYGVVSRGDHKCGQIALPTIFTAVHRYGGFVAAWVPAPEDARAWPTASPRHPNSGNVIGEGSSGAWTGGTPPAPRRSNSARPLVGVAVALCALFYV
jgi:secreted trypsin-like serine protease